MTRIARLTLGHRTTYRHRDVQGVVHVRHAGGGAWCNRDVYNFGGVSVPTRAPVTCLWCHSGYEAEPIHDA